MKALGKVELAKKILAMRVRARLRLKAQEQYVNDLNAVLPMLEEKFDQSVLAGELPDPLKALPEVLDAD